MTNKNDIIRVGLIFVAAIALYFLLQNYMSGMKPSESYADMPSAAAPGSRVDSMQGMSTMDYDRAATFDPRFEDTSAGAAATGTASAPAQGEMQYPAPMGADCFPKDQLSADDLLPKDDNNMWAAVNPKAQGSLEGVNFIQAGVQIGVNTVGQSLKNANYQLRSDPPNPKMNVSPWLNSTIDADNNRRPLEIGSC